MKMSDRFGSVPNFDIKEFFDDDQMFAIPNVHLCYEDINKAVNNHDRMADEIAQLREAISEMIKYKGILTSDNQAIINAKKLLNK